MDLLFGISTAFGLAASAGLNAYIPLLVIGLLARFTELFTLESPWNILENWWIIGVLLFLSTIEFFADKFPAVNHINDLIQTFVRPTAGAIVFAASTSIISNINPIFSVALGLLVAGGVHTVKSAAIRPLVTASTGGVGNIIVSTLEDILSTVVSLVSVFIPILIIVFFSIFIMWFGSKRLKIS